MKQLAIVAAVLIILSGCGSTSQGSKEFDTANQLINAKQYREAIAYLEQAVNQDPKNDLYAAKLNEVKVKFSQQSLSQVRQLLSTELTKQNLDEAESILKEISESGIDMPEISVLSLEIEEKRQSLYQQLAVEYAQINKAIEAQDWLTAHGLLKRVTQRFPNYENTQLLSKNVVSAANKYYLKEANIAIKQNDFTKAKNLLSELMQIIPNNQIAKAMFKKADLNDNYEFFLAKAKLATKNNQWADVIDN